MATATEQPTASALRFPKADGMIVVTEQVHASQTYTREVRISVRHIICYYPTTGSVSARRDGSTTMQIEGRSQPVRILHTVDELDELVASFPNMPGDPLDLVTVGQG